VIMQGDDASVVAEVVNATVSKLIDANIDFRSRQARVTTDFMKREFERADAELRRHQRDLANFRALHRGSLPEEQESTIAKLERLEEQRRSLILQLSESRDRLSQLEAAPSAPGTRASIEALRIQLETAKTLYTDEHPTVRSLERRLMILSETEGPESPADPLFEERTSLRAEINRQEDRLSQIDTDADQIEARLAATPRISEEYAALVRREQILQENYVEYLRKLKDAELSLSLESAQQGAQLARLDTALTPTDPIIPRWLLAIGAAAVSVMLSIGIAIVRELIFPVVIDQAHLETLTPLPCLGSIPEIR
jgi:succinoglycan biosynthesis transport protein ExoP